MRKSRLILSTMAIAVFAVTSGGLVACDKASGDTDVVSPATSYTVTLDANGGSLQGVISLKTDENGVVSFDNVYDPTRTDCTFTGWYTQSVGGTKVDGSYVFTSDSVIYAQWTMAGGSSGESGEGENSESSPVYTITFNANGGSYAEGENGVRSWSDGAFTGGGIPVPTAPVSMVFDGWYSSSVDGVLVSVTSYTFVQDATLYAHWTTPSEDSGNGSGGSGGSAGDSYNDGLTYESASTGIHFVGNIAGVSTDWDWGNGYKMTLHHNSEWDYDEYSVTVYLQEGDSVKIRDGSDGVGYSQIENGGSLSCLTADSSDDNILITEDGYFTIYYKPTWGSGKIYVAFSTSAPD